MMLKVNGQYLDFNGDIEIERKVKLFQNIEKTDGDMSFAFEVELTSNNLTALGLPLPDSSTKRVYRVVPTEVFDDNGLIINKGSIRIENIVGRIASCSFLGGNSNWFAALTGNMTELDLSRYDVELNDTTISSSWNNTSGIIFPLIDTGTLITRGYSNSVTADFVGCFFAHTLLRETFKQSGLKIQGELLDDPFFNSLVIVTNTRSINDINNNSYFVGRESNYSVPSLTDQDIVFDSFTDPYYIGEDVVINSNTEFVIQQDMVAEVEIFSQTAPGSDLPIDVELLIDGIDQFSRFTTLNISVTRDATNGATATRKIRVKLYKDEIVKYTIENDYLVTVELERATVKFKPIFIYKTFGKSCVPLWTKKEFVANLLQHFNTITSFDDYTKTVTINLFNKIKEKESIDISDYLEVEDQNYTEFVSDFGKSNKFLYQEPSDEDLKEYNISSFIKYGDGEVLANNDFMEESAEVVESDFSTPISYVNPVFDASIERIDFVEFDEDEEQDISSVSDASGIPRFNISNADDFYEEGDLVRIETDVIQYNGDFVVSQVTSTYIVVRGLDYLSNASGSATRLTHVFTTDDSVYIMAITKSTDTNDIFDKDSVYIDDSAKTIFSIAFFNLLRIGRPIESAYKQGLSFGRVSSPLFFQRTLLQTYWPLFERIINDPVMLKNTAHLPWKVYNSIDFLRPITIRSIESSNQYYCNRILGFKDSSRPCLVELIKLP